MKKCLNCNTALEARTGRAKFCSDVCRVQHNRKQGQPGKLFSLRLDPDKIRLVQDREQLAATQQVVEWLLDKYYSKYNQPEKPVKQAVVSDGCEPQRPIKAETATAQTTVEVVPQTTSLRRTIPAAMEAMSIMADYVARRRDIDKDNPEQFKQWQQDLSDDARLTSKQKQAVLYAGVGGIG